MTAVPEASPTVKCVQVDPRVSPDHSQSCSGYSQNSQLTHGFLFPPGRAAGGVQMSVKEGNKITRYSGCLFSTFTVFSTSAASRYDASLITNTVPMYPAFKSESICLNRDLKKCHGDVEKESAFLLHMVVSER